jgi:enoyl-CoA hydratase/carnithine racemase
LADFVKIEKGLGPEGRIAVVRFDRGDGINAMSPEAMRQLTDAARSFEDDDATSVVVLTGGAKSFTAGFDLKDPEGRSRKSMDLGTLRRHLKLGPRLTRAWQEMEQITIGAIEGFCVGGGVALAVALDFRVMARDAHMRVPEIGLGMNMSWQSVPRMLHLMGPARTKQAVILADQRISAADAYEWRLVEEVAEPGKAFDAAMALAAKVAAQPPLSVAMTKLTVNRLAHALDDLTSHMDVEAQTKAATCGANDFIGKPFLPIEITVKALTFAWEGRLKKLPRDCHLMIQNDPLTVDKCGVNRARCKTILGLKPRPKRTY